MKHVFVLLLCSFWTLNICAQPAIQMLTGIISLTTGEVFPYKIEFTESNGVIKGYSFTYKEPNDTKAAIKGTLDRQMHTLSFRETDIIYSHGFQTRAFMCLIDASLEYRSGEGNILTGPIASKETDKTLCTPGTLLFNNSEQIKKLFSYHDKYDTVISMGKKPADNHKTPQPIKPAINEPPVITEQVTAGVEKSYDWHSDTVVIDVWDGGNVDGDRISLFFNGKPCLTNYFLVKEKRQVRLPLSEGINIISILADNEGSDPPNTADLLLTDGTLKYSVLAYNNKGNRAIIKIKRVR
jgi:hypothetical protein